MGCKSLKESSVQKVTEIINVFDQLIGWKHLNAKVQNNIMATFMLKTKYLSIEKLVP